MCRILVLAPHSNRKEALAILDNMVGKNLDGTGEVYVENGKFIVNKYPYSLYKVLRKGRAFLNGLAERNSCTLIHVRSASMGKIGKENTHPFISLNNKIAMVHNGTWRDCKPLLAYLQTCIGFDSTCDSACATELVSRIGMRAFTEMVDFSGVFVSLKLDGTVDIGKTNGDLALYLQEDKTCLIASELDDKKYEKTIEMARGHFKFDNNLRYITHKTKSYSWQGGGEYSDWYGGERKTAESLYSKIIHTGENKSDKWINNGAGGVSHISDFHGMYAGE